MPNDKPLEPVPEDYAGKVYPYRGTETHGVPDPEYTEPDLEFKGEHARVEYEEPEREHDPIPVIIVNESAREETQWRVSRVPIDNGQSTHIVARDRRRTSVIVKVVTGSIVISDQPNPVAFTGFPLVAGETFTTDAVTPVYATATSNADVAVLQSYRVEL